MPRLPRARTCHWKCKFSFTCTYFLPPNFYIGTPLPYLYTCTNEEKIVLAVQVLHMTSPTCTLAHLRTLGPAPHPTPLASDCPKNTISSLKLVALKSFLITIEMMVVTEPELRVLFGSVTLCPRSERQICSERHFLQPPSPHLQQDHHLDLHNHHIQFIIKRNAHFPCPKHKPMDLQYFFSFRCWCILREAVVMMKDRHRTRWWWRSAPPAWFAEQTSGGGV